MIATTGSERDPRRIAYPRRIDVVALDDAPGVYGVMVDGHAWGTAHLVSGADGYLIRTPDRQQPRKRHAVPVTRLRQTIHDLVVDDRRRARARTPRLH